MIIALIVRKSVDRSFNYMTVIQKVPVRVYLFI